MTEATHPIMPPQELVEKWANLPDDWNTVVSIIAEWGADIELEACCEWVSKYLPYLGDFPMPEDKLRAARRPKPPSLKEQALRDLADIEANYGHLTRPEMLLQSRRADTIRRALEALPE